MDHIPLSGPLIFPFNVPGHVIYIILSASKKRKVLSSIYTKAHLFIPLWSITKASCVPFNEKENDFVLCKILISIVC